MGKTSGILWLSSRLRNDNTTIYQDTKEYVWTIRQKISLYNAIQCFCGKREDASLMKHLGRGLVAAI